MFKLAITAVKGTVGVAGLGLALNLAACAAQEDAPLAEHIASTTQPYVVGQDTSCRLTDFANKKAQRMAGNAVARLFGAGDNPAWPWTTGPACDPLKSYLATYKSYLNAGTASVSMSPSTVCGITANIITLSIQAGANNTITFDQIAQAAHDCFSGSPNVIDGPVDGGKASRAFFLTNSGPGGSPLNTILLDPEPVVLSAALGGAGSSASASGQSSGNSYTGTGVNGAVRYWTASSQSCGTAVGGQHCSTTANLASQSVTNRFIQQNSTYCSCPGTGD